MQREYIIKTRRRQQVFVFCEFSTLQRDEMFQLKTALLALLLPGCLADPARWCCKSVNEFEKCKRLGLESKIFGSTFKCVQADGSEKCAQAILANEADVTFLHGSYIFEFRRSLVVVASENYGIGDASYFGVAVVKKNARADLTMATLDGARSCHTGIGKSSGWVTPMGWIARNYNMPDESGRLPLYDPFSESCAPGANNPYYIEKLPDPRRSEKWCGLCIGDSSGLNVCNRGWSERYYGYPGALRCLADGKGEVAFVKQVTVPVNQRDNYQLLCRDGSRANPEDWEDCNLSKIPANGLVMRIGTSRSQSDLIVNALHTAQEKIDASMFFHFRSLSNLMWKSTTKLFDGPFHKTPRQFLGIDYYCNMLVVEGDPIADECLPSH